MAKIIYFFQTYFHKGGAEKNVLQLVSGFYKKHQISLAGPRAKILKDTPDTFPSF